MRSLPFFHQVKRQCEDRRKPCAFLSAVIDINCCVLSAVRSVTNRNSSWQINSVVLFCFVFLDFLTCWDCVCYHTFSKEKKGLCVACGLVEKSSDIIYLGVQDSKKTKQQITNVASRSERACETHANWIKSDVKTNQTSKRSGSAAQSPQNAAWTDETDAYKQAISGLINSARYHFQLPVRDWKGVGVKHATAHLICTFPATLLPQKGRNTPGRGEKNATRLSLSQRGSRKQSAPDG